MFLDGLARYKLFDLTAFALILCLAEALSAWALAYFSGEAYTFSPSLFVALLMSVRWGMIGFSYSALGGLVFCIAHGGTPAQFAVYTAGSAFVAVNGLWLRFIGTEKLRDSFLYTALYAVSGYTAVCAGRALISGALGQGFWFVRFFTVDTLTLAVTVILLFIARKQNGLYEPQLEFLLRIKKEEEARKHDT